MLNILTLSTAAFLSVGRSNDTTAGPKHPPVDTTHQTTLTVQNDRNVPLTVYAQTDISEYRLGNVAPFGVATVRIADYMIGQGDITFFVQPRGQLEESTAPMDVERGQRLGIIVPPRK